MRKADFCVALVAVSLTASAAFGQTGPAEAKMLMAAMPNVTLPQTRGEAPSTEVELAIDSSGRVTQVDIRESSGDSKYDEKVRRYYRKMRFIPALDAVGTPIASTKTTRLTTKKISTLDPIWKSDLPDHVVPVENRAAADEVEQEVRRISRMRCKDFLWEYDLMKDVAGNRPIEGEALFRTLQAMYIVQEKPAGAAIAQMRSQFSGMVLASVDACHKSADASFFQEVFVPTLRVKLRPE